MIHASQGAAALAASDGPVAVSAYTKALIEHPHSPDFFTQRAIAFTRIKPPRYDLSLKDADYAVLLGRKRQKREKIQAAQQRRVVAFHGKGEYQNAKFVLEKMQRWRSADNKKDKMEGDIWRAKVEQKLRANPEVQHAQVTAGEYPSVQLPEERNMVSWLKSQLDKDGSYNFEKDSDTMTDAVQPAEATNQATADGQDPAADASTKQTSIVPAKIRNEWYQNSQTVTVTLYAKNVSKSFAKFDVQEDSVFVEFPHPSDTGASFTFSLDPLFALIDPANSKLNVFKTKVEILLSKKLTGQKWAALEGSEPLKRSIDDQAPAKAAVMSTLQNDTGVKSSTAPSYPTSSRSGPKNWDKLASDLTKKPKKKDKEGDEAQSVGEDADEGYDDDEFGGDAVDGFFKKLYKGADPDTRRAMMKSFQESNGTALSTNWSEVGKGRVDPVKSKDDD